MKRRALLVACCALGLAPLAQEPVRRAEPAQPVTVILVRHAEKAATGGQDPELSPVGSERAEALARLLSSSHASRLFATEFRRTQQTLAPLARLLEREVETIPARDQEAWLVALASLEPGAVAVVAGHSNTVPALAAALGGEVGGLVDHPRAGPVIDDATYDRLFVLTLPLDEDGATKTLELRYGAE